MTSIQEKYLDVIQDALNTDLLTVMSKMEDYSEDGDPFSNFRFAADAAGVTVDQVFLVLYGVKVARLRKLLRTDKEPNNESIIDTMGDLARYARIHEAYHKLKNTDDPTYLYATEDAKVAAQAEEVLAEPTTPGEKLKKLLGF